ncbi:MAG: hypothetical protein N3B12_08595 [Armatimonadetes bacterium]|nr:hypothetical protein [Armatimonadota bacterium]
MLKERRNLIIGKIKRSASWLLLFICYGVACANDVQIDWLSINSAGGLARGGEFSVAYSVGQAAAGFSSNERYLHWIGFWSSEALTPTAVGSIRGVKNLPDGARVAIVGKVATTSTADFAGLFYIEEQDRTSGLLVLTPLASLNIARGSIVNVIGTVGTSLSGERFIIGSIVVVASSAVE